MNAHPVTDFVALYGGSDDPYGVRTRWYEKRKRAVLLAALPCERFRNAYEPGCGIGELTVELAGRCDRLLASDASARAVEIARERTRGLSGVRIKRQGIPSEWPEVDGPFDLVVLSEVGYFLDADALRCVARACDRSLAPGGTLVACDWRPDFAGRALPTDAVHSLLAATGLARLVRHEEDDFLLQVWSRDARSVAVREGIR